MKKRNMIKFKIQLFISVISVCASFAQMKNYSYKNELMGVNNTWHSLQLPNSVFSNCQEDFSDIRIYGITATDTIEAPYVLNKVNDVYRVKKNQKSFSVINKVKRKEGYSVTLENSDRKRINKINLIINDQNYDYNVGVEGSKNQLEWVSVKDSSRILHIKNKHIDFSHSDLNFEPINFPFIRLTFKEKKDVNFQEANYVEFTDIKKHYIAHKPVYVIEEDKKGKQTIIHVKLPYKTPIAKVNLIIDNSFDYYRAMHIESLQDSVVTEKGVLYQYKNIHRQYISSFDDELQDFGYQHKNDFVKELKITINNHDNTPLEIKGVGVQSNPVALKARFDNLEASYYLVSGNEKSKKPNYDIESFTNKIPGGISALTVGNIQVIDKITSKKETKTFFTNTVLWGVLLVIIGFLGFFTYKMLKEK